MTYREGYCQGRERLLQAGIDEAELEARLLLEYVCGTNRNDLLAHGDMELEAYQEKEYVRLIGRRVTRIPLQHLTGNQEFMGLSFRVNEHVLIPRQDTEILVEEVLRHLHDGMRVLDMCTGSGCILISLLHYSNHCQGVGADLSGEALAVAEENAECLLGRERVSGGPRMSQNAGDTGGQPAGISVEAGSGHGALEMAVNDGCCVTGQTIDAGEGAGGQAVRDDSVGAGAIRFVRSDLFEEITGKFDIIVSNPPYICSDVVRTLMPEVREHEPLRALDGGTDGLDFYRRIISEVRNYLFGGGMLFFEIGYDQGKAVSSLLEEAGFLEVRVVKDYAGLDRVVCGTLGFG